MNSKFWLNDINVLYENKNYLIFFPNKSFTFVENLNAIVRLGFYYSLICYIYTGNLDAFVPFVIICIITLMLYKTSDYIEPFEMNNKKRKSTIDNPMINLSVTDYGKENVGIADIEDKNINENLVKDLYNDIGDLSNKQFFERNFYTTPITTVPNDQGGFAEWLYKRDTCKSGNMEECYKNVDTKLDMGILKT